MRYLVAFVLLAVVAADIPHLPRKYLPPPPSSSSRGPLFSSKYSASFGESSSRQKPSQGKKYYEATPIYETDSEDNYETIKYTAKKPSQRQRQRQRQRQPTKTSSRDYEVEYVDDDNTQSQNPQQYKYSQPVALQDSQQFQKTTGYEEQNLYFQPSQQSSQSHEEQQYDYGSSYDEPTRQISKQELDKLLAYDIPQEEQEQAVPRGYAYKNPQRLYQR